jgi:flagellar hook-length control protein FliK
MDGDIVIAKIQVESQQVKQIVESNLQSLKDSLSEHNLQAGSFDVNVGSGWGRQPGEAGDGGFAKQHNVSGSLSGEDLQTSLETGTVAHTGQETGRRFGSNTVEFFG